MNAAGCRRVLAGAGAAGALLAGAAVKRGAVQDDKLDAAADQVGRGIQLARQRLVTGDAWPPASGGPARSQCRQDALGLGSGSMLLTHGYQPQRRRH